MRSRTLVIGDVHGCVRTFKELLFTVIRLKQHDNLYLLGDTVDRGPASKEVVDTIVRMRSAGYSVHVLRGNHEEMLLHAHESPAALQIWLANGGAATLESFLIPSPARMPPHYLQFFANLPYYFLLDDFVLVHAGVNCAATDPFSDTDAMLWSRSLTIDRAKLGGRRVVCAHTPHPLQAIQKSTTEDLVTIDGGCVYRESCGLGNLVALQLPGMELFSVTNMD
jgi:serine/threonine protein phosphatase 1